MSISPLPYNPLEGDRPELKIDLDNGTDERIAIVVVHRDRPELLNMCLQSIVMTSVNNNIDIVVVDNASTTKDAIDYLEVLSKQPDIKIIRNEANIWWAAACNQGARAADKKAKYLIFMHQDCVVLNPAWLDVFVSISEAQDAGMISLEQGIFQYDRQKIPYLKEWCLMVSRDCWRDCGPFAEELRMVGSSFVMTQAALHLGYKPIVLGKLSLVHHYGAFSMDFSEFERMGEQSAALIPKLVREIKQKPERK